LLDAVKATAKKAGIPYQRFIRQAIEAAIPQAKRPGSVKSLHHSGK
jgi:hypothetical protein